MRRIPNTCAAALSAALFTASFCSARGGEHEAEPSSTATDHSTPGAIVPEEVHLNLIDQKLALSLAVDTQGQIELGTYALNSVSNESLRTLLTNRLAQQRVFAEELNQLTRGRAQEAIDRARTEIEADKQPNQQPERRLNLLALRRNATAMVVRIRLEQLQEYAELLRSELNAESSSQFDRDYLRCEVLHQMQILAMLKVFQDQASADFARFVEQAAGSCTVHLNRAKQLLLQIETAPLADTAPPSIPVSAGAQ